jgi:hypothetical protein
MMHFATPKSYLVFAHFAIYVQNHVNLMSNSPILDPRTTLRSACATIQVILICRQVDITYV